MTEVSRAREKSRLDRSWPGAVRTFPSRAGPRFRTGGAIQLRDIGPDVPMSNLLDPTKSISSPNHKPSLRSVYWFIPKQVFGPGCVLWDLRWLTTPLRGQEKAILARLIDYVGVYRVEDIGRNWGTEERKNGCDVWSCHGPVGRLDNTNVIMGEKHWVGLLRMYSHF